MRWLRRHQEVDHQDVVRSLTQEARAAEIATRQAISASSAARLHDQALRTLPDPVIRERR